MKRGYLYKTSLIAALAFVTPFVRSALAEKLPACSDESTCSGDEPLITEMIQGAVDGQNDTFRVTRAPASEVRVFRNGIPLVNGLDYTVKGQTITLLRNQVPVPGDMLLARYIPGRAVRQPDTTILQVPSGIVPGVVSSAIEMAAAACREALMAEVVQAGGGTSISNDQGLLHTDLSNASDQQPSSESVKMPLEQTKKRGASSNFPDRSQPRTSKSVQGVDGLGDQPVSLMFPNELSEQAAPDSFSPAPVSPDVDSGVRLGRAALPSKAVRMLELRVKATDSPDNLRSMDPQ